MEVYSTEQEQVEALKRWWTNNGRSVIAGVVLAIVVVFGWKAWGSYQQQQAEQASDLLLQMMAEMEQDAAQAMETGKVLTSDYAGSHYAVVAYMNMASLAVEADDLATAEQHLQAALQSSDSVQWREMARIQLTRVQLAQGDAQAAMTTLDAASGMAYQPQRDELRGDIYLLQGEREKAYVSYQSALSGYNSMPGKAKMVQAKLGELADVATAMQSEDEAAAAEGETAAESGSETP